MTKHFCILIVVGVTWIYKWFWHWNTVIQDVTLHGWGMRERDTGPLIIFSGNFLWIFNFFSFYKRNCYTCNNLDESPQHYPEWKKSISKGYILWDPTHITFLKQQNCRNGEWSVISRDEAWDCGERGRLTQERCSWWWNTHTQMSAGKTDKIWVRSVYCIYINFLAEILHWYTQHM